MRSSVDQWTESDSLTLNVMDDVTQDIARDDDTKWAPESNNGDEMKIELKEMTKFWIIMSCFRFSFISFSSFVNLLSIKYDFCQWFSNWRSRSTRG